MAIRARLAGSLPGDLPGQRDASSWVRHANVYPSSDTKSGFKGANFPKLVFFSPADLKTQKKARSHILLSVRSHASLRFLQINEGPAGFRRAGREGDLLLRVRCCFHHPSFFLVHRLSQDRPGRSPGGLCAGTVFLSPGGQSSKPAMCACEKPLCIFRKFLSGRQPKCFYCSAGAVSCWRKKKETKGRGGEDSGPAG